MMKFNVTFDIDMSDFDDVEFKEKIQEEAVNSLSIEFMNKLGNDNYIEDISEAAKKAKRRITNQVAEKLKTEIDSEKISDHVYKKVVKDVNEKTFDKQVNDVAEKIKSDMDKHIAELVKKEVKRSFANMGK